MPHDDYKSDQLFITLLVQEYIYLRSYLSKIQIVNRILFIMLLAITIFLPNIYLGNSLNKSTIFILIPSLVLTIVWQYEKRNIGRRISYIEKEASYDRHKDEVFEDIYIKSKPLMHNPISRILLSYEPMLWMGSVYFQVILLMSGK